MDNKVISEGSSTGQQNTNGPMLEFDRPPSTGWMRLSLVPGFPREDPRSLILRPPDGLKGVYLVTVVLGTPGRAQFNDLLELGKLASSGDSLLEIGRVEMDLTITSGEVTAFITAASNNYGQLASIRLRVDAQDFNDAIRFSYDLLAPTLSWWSYYYDVPLDIKGYEVIEESTETRQYLVGILGAGKGFDREASFFTFGQELKSLIATYREAMNANNLFYKVLSLYKVTEGSKALSNERKKKVLSGGYEWREPQLRLPNSVEELETDEWNKNAFLPFVGKKFTWILDHYRALIRNAVAHLDPTTNVLVGDKFQDVAACEEAVPVLKYLARAMLEVEIQAQSTQ